VRDAVAALHDAPYQAPSAVGPIRLLIFGGSQGASVFSAAPLEAIEKMPAHLRARLDVVHQVRESEIEEVRTRYRRAEVKAEIAPFFADLPARIANAHLVIARAGASTVTELATIGRPSILVPLAIAMDDHQTGNAKALADAGAAIVIAEKELNEESLTKALTPLFEDLSKLAAMAASARGRVRANASAILADLVEKIAAKKAAA
jgi:UDP-N-acetylglucosamine--N-acetylmuramyl-(pentapeptide) pyrophosphoryl-undecaprenol N-acetylglucosamine transferase